MIDAAINYIASSINQHLMRISGLHEDVVVVSNILEQDGTVATHVNNRIVVSLVNIEKDTVPLTHQQSATGSSMRTPVTSPPIHFNLYLMFASYFSGNNYQEGLKFLSNTICYFQGQSVFDQQNSPGLDRSIDKLILDIQNLTMDDLSNLWGILSGKYLPSVLYRVRMVTYEANAVKGQTPSLSKPLPTMSH
ncbi:MAG: DUF4255 domain-containing protein [Gammaproteobacteria bacterium]|nr:DUF4255 domain-containing protein [Gammaproteobacteria bacterium]